MLAFKRSRRRILHASHPSLHHPPSITPLRHGRFAVTQTRALGSISFGQTDHFLGAHQQPIASSETTFQSSRVILSRQISTHYQQLDLFVSNRDIDYNELKLITQMPTSVCINLDVREEEEVIHSNIPSSVNIPLSKFEKALGLHEDDFKTHMGFLNPSQNHNVV